MSTTHPLPTGATRPARLEICPPRRTPQRHPWLARLSAWLAAGWPATRERELQREPLRQLQRARQDFLAAIADIDDERGDELSDRIHFARSLRELWHLRAEVFSLVSRCRDQHEADERLAELNLHFPTRAPRSGFAPLEPRESRQMWP